jgi:hypothetical protein
LSIFKVFASENKRNVALIDKTQKTVKSKTQAGQTPIHSALIGGALSEVAKSRPKLDYNGLGSEGD